MNDARAIREAAGLTQAELARRSGIAQPNIAAYESGRRRASSAMLERLRTASQPLPSQAIATHRDALLKLAEQFGFSDVRVFGSAARGDDAVGSDLDLLVTRRADVGLLAVAGFADAASDLLGVRVDIVTDGGITVEHEIARTAVAV